MPNKKITELTVAGALVGTEKLEIVQDGENRQVTAQDIANLGGSVPYGVASGTNTYIVTASPVPIAYVAGLMIKVLFTNGNTGSSTINPNGLGAKSIKRNVSSNLVLGDILDGSTCILIYDGTNFQILGTTRIESLGYALSDETTVLNIGTKLTDRMPYAFHVIAVRISLTTPQSTSVFVTVDVKKNGVSILSTLVSVDNNEKTSVTAAYPVVISAPDFADDDEISFSITQVGTATVAAGLKARLIGYRI